MLHDASDDAEIMGEPSLFPFFTLSSLTHPHTHQTFCSLDSTTAIFADGKGSSGTLSNAWTASLRKDLVDFCDRRLPLVSPPKLVALFQAFHKWETSLQSHITSSVKVCRGLKQLTMELIGQNVKLVAALEGGGGTPSKTFIENMKRFVIQKKRQIKDIDKKIEPSEVSVCFGGRAAGGFFDPPGPPLEIR